MKKRPRIIDELWSWVSGRFTLTDEEKLWLLLVLIICWTGLLGRYFFLRNQPPHSVSIETLIQEAP